MISVVIWVIRSDISSDMGDKSDISSGIDMGAMI